jgi:hemoglobin/transferrin/lactoferrin receptor protein
VADGSAGPLAGGPDEEPALETIVVVASKSPRPLSEIAAQVTVIDEAAMKAALVENLDGLLKYEPGIDLQTEGSRFGGSGVNIRGIGGNRVDIEIDGVPVRDRFAIGDYSNGGRGLVETDRIKRVEILYGPASVMYGSDALGGVVAVTTWDPSDLLTLTDRTAWIGVRGGYQGANDSWVGSALTAWGDAKHGLLAAATWRNGHQLENQAPASVPVDPQSWSSQDYLFRYTFDTQAGDRLRLSAAFSERDVATELNSQLGYGRRYRYTTALAGEDNDRGNRLSLDYEFSFGLGWRGIARVYGVRQTTDQHSFETRAAAPRPVDIERRFYYRQQLSGAEVNLFRDLDGEASSHRLGVGAEWKRKDIAEQRDGLQTSLIDNTSTGFILGEDLPVRDFPNSRTGEFGLFVQDEISLSGGSWQLIPALRWDRYVLDPRPDEVWSADNPDTPVVRVTEEEFTPRLGVLFHPGRNWTLFGQYSRGFRAPPFEDANIGFDIPLFGFRAIPNPALRSETSDGLELGLRYHAAGTHLSFSLFNTDYEDFIESRALIGADPESGDLIFQSRNIDRARIRGADLRLEQDLSTWRRSLEGWRFRLAAFWAAGENRQTGQPLNSIAPPQAVVGLSWLSGGGDWDLELNGTLTAAKHADDIDSSDGERFPTPSWIVVDLTAGWRPGPRVELRAGLFNLGNETYWRWLDVANRQADDPMIRILSRPGRNFTLTARVAF